MVIAEGRFTIFMRTTRAGPTTLVIYRRRLAQNTALKERSGGGEAAGKGLKSEEGWEADASTNNYVSATTEMRVATQNGDAEETLN